MNKRFTLSLGSLLLILGLIFSLTGCNQTSNDDENDDDDVEVTEPTLTVQESIEINVGQNKTIEVLIGNTEENLEVIFSSDDSNIASVDSDGLVTAITSGETTITVKLKEYPNVKKEVNVEVIGLPLSINGLDSLFVGETITLTATDENGQNNIGWESSNPTIATIDETGLITGISGGKVMIRVTSTNTGQYVEKEITVEVPAATSIEVSRTSESTILSFSQVQLKYQVLPVNASQEVIWTSSNEDIATVDEKGLVNALKSGSVDIIATSKEDSEIKGIITLNIEVDPVALIRSLNVDSPLVQYVSTYGNTVKQQWVYGSVSRYYPGDLNLDVNIINITPTIDGTPNPYIGQVATQDMLNSAEFKTVRSGILKPEIKSIIYHDTGNNSLGANADMHARYIIGDANFSQYKARSWHYTVDDTQAIQHLPDNEVAWQGDTYLAYSTTIGIETCVDEGSDLYTTWHRTAKLMANLLVEHDLKVTDIKQHYDYSQKNCPQTLRRSGLYNNAIDLVRAEHLVLTELEGYTITYKSNHPDYVDDFGRIIKLDETPKRVSYMVTVTNQEGYNKTIMCYSTLPAKTN